MSDDASRKIKYRPDIDGLRSVAVLPVLIYHLGMKKIAPGGFVGVDIFFVISGFLITGIIYNSISRNNFSVIDFYYRRIRRIIPAVSVIYIFCLIASMVLLFRSEQEAVSHSIISSILFSSNIYFYSLAGYFDDISKLSPVLHTWSLSVEEQFYFFVPPIIIALARFGPRALKGALIGITAASFIAAIAYIGHDPSAVFYLLPFRAWELLFGSLLAIGLISPPRSKMSAQLLSMGGITLIGGSILLLTPATLFPGWAALPAVLGAALIIHAGSTYPNTVVGHILASWPFRFIGLISYSLYLWHWPVIVFYPHIFGIPDLVGKVGMFFASIALAILSWRFVEQPFRHPKSGSARKWTYLSALTILATIAIATLAGPAILEHIRPTPPLVTKILAQQDHSGMSWREEQCFLTSKSHEFARFDKRTCLRIDPARTNVLLLGDSHAAQYYGALTRAFPRVNVLQANASGCRPVPAGQFDEMCRTMMHFMLDTFLRPGRDLDGILLAGRWTSADTRQIGTLVRTLESRGYKVDVIGPVPEYTQALPRLVAASLIHPAMDVQLYRDPHIKSIDAAMQAAVEQAGATYFSPYQILCPDTCRIWAQTGKIVQFDYGHLSQAGSELLINEMKTRIEWPR